MKRWNFSHPLIRCLLLNRLERDKAEALNTQKEAMNRAFRAQLAKLLKEKEELIRKVQSLQQAKDAPPSAHNCKGPAPLPGSTGSSAPCQSAVELQKLIHENNILRIEKKKQEEQLQVRFIDLILDQSRPCR